jgi:hypothetical protein
VAPPDAQVSVEGRIAKDRGGFIANIAISDHAGTVLGSRQLHGDGPDCRTLDERLAFVIAIALDPNAALLALPGELSDDAQPEAAALAELRASATRPPAAEPERSRLARASPLHARTTDAVEVRALAALGAAAGTAAGVGLGLGLGAEGGVAIDGWPLLVSIAWWLPQRREIDDVARIELSAFELGLRVCAPLLRAGRVLDVALCGGGRASQLSVRPRGWSGQTRSAWAFGPELALRGGLRLTGPLFLQVAAALSGQWPRARFGLDAGAGIEVVHTAPVPRASVGAGLALRL